MAKRKRGRPTALTPQVQADICERLEKGVPQVDAARLAGISASAFYGWLQRGRDGEQPFADFSDAVERARARAKEVLIDQVLMYATADQKDSWRAGIALYQELHGSSRGAEREKAREEVTGEILDRLRTRLDSEAFSRVVAALCDEGSGELPGRGASRIH